jgi:hypothetical protein
MAGGSAQALASVMWGRLDTELGRYLLSMCAIVPLLGMLFYMIYQHELRQIPVMADGMRETLSQAIGLGFMKVFAALVVVTAIVTWWIVLTHKSRQVAQEESNRQTQALNEQAHALRHEIESHQRTDEALQQAKRTADLANQAKSATSRPSATSCARRSTASSATPSCSTRTRACRRTASRR